MVIYCHSTVITKVMLLYNTEWWYDHGKAVNYHGKKFYNIGPWWLSNQPIYLQTLEYLFTFINEIILPKCKLIPLNVALLGFRYFPSQGEKTHIFATELQFPEELCKVDNLVSRLASQDIITQVRCFSVIYDNNFRSIIKIIF